MRIVCAYCRVVIREHVESCVEGTSHGMCPSCAQHFERLWEGGMSFSDYLDTLPAPIVVMNGEGRVIGANKKIASLFGRDTVELRGLPPGDAFACVWSRLPEGCGGSVHCRECTIRRAVARIHETGEPVHGARAWVQTEQGLVDVLISVAAEEALVKVVVEPEQPPPGCPPAEA
jgi:PAS domain-containing protein